MTGGDHAARSILHYLSLLTAVIAVVWGYTVWQSFEGRRDLVGSQRSGCERGKLDRLANAEGWRAAETARRASGTVNDLRAARKYQRIAEGLEDRARVKCDDVFPSPSLLPF